MANSNASSNPESARSLGHASIGMSVAGIIITVIIIIVVVAVQLSAASCVYQYNGKCYRYYKYVGVYGYCNGAKSGSICYYN